MYRRFLKNGTIFFSWLMLVGLAVITTSSVEVFRLSARLRQQYLNFDSNIVERVEQLKIEARQRAYAYDFLIRTGHMSAGMVVNRNYLGQISSICDSLLFSSLRFVALKKLGDEEEALKAWLAIEKSQKDGQWLRHPECQDHNTSRDMIVGVLAALTQQPPNYRFHLRNLIDYIDENNGYIGRGPFHVSRLSPGLGEILRLMAEQEDIRSKSLPRDIRYGFSTLEFDSLASQRGYTSHLNAMVIWIELEMLRHFLKQENQEKKIRSIASVLGPITDNLLPFSIAEQRLQWLTQRLVRLDRSNMFFRWLQYEAADAMSPKAKKKLLEELLGMEMFPKNRLPTTCERKADYLWQRNSVEYVPRDHKLCSEIFSGVDFIWMASLLSH